MNSPIGLEILVIEDNPSDADFLIEMIETVPRTIPQYQNFEINCQWADSLKKACEIIAEKNFDVVLVDLGLPDSTGLETIKVLADLSLPGPIIVLTGNIRDNSWIEAIHLGVQDYLCKSEIEVKLLMRTISHAIERYKLRVELHENMLKLENYSQRLEQSNKELESFAYVASHDLQEPLRNMLAYGERISENYKDLFDDKGKFFIERLLNSGIRMQHLLDDLLEYSRVSTRKLNIRELDLNKLFYQIFCDLEMIIQESQASITIKDLNSNSEIKAVTNGVIKSDFHTKNTVYKIKADEVQLRRAFQNIIQNALKYRKADAKIEIQIRLELSDNILGAAIEDNGIGFEEQFKDKIFEQFQRLHSRSEYDGTGMGLATVKKIIELHDGNIQVNSQPGIGSCFKVEIPMKKMTLTY